MRCKIDALLNKINLPKLSKQDEVTFTLIKDLPNCRRIKTKNTYTGTADGKYDKYLVPANRFECLGEGCVNTGTYRIDEGVDTNVVKYFGRFDATEIGAGAVAFYIYDPDKAAHDFLVVVSSDSSATNADRYMAAVTAADYDEDGFAPVVVDFAGANAGELGTGWEPSYAGVYITISTDARFGISSIAFFESIEDFATVDVVKVGCLSSMGGTLDASVIEAACSKAKYNDQMSGVSFPVTGRTATPNYYLLNPLHGNGKADKGFFIATEEYTVGDDYKVTLADMLQSECRFLTVQRQGACDPYDGMMSQLVVPRRYNTALTPEYYTVKQNEDGTTTLTFANSLAGEKVLISYPREVEVIERVSNADNLNSVHVSMAFSVKLSEHVTEMHVFNNVFVTSFPYSISENDTDFSFTLNIQPDKNGDYNHIYRIVD